MLIKGVVVFPVLVGLLWGGEVVFNMVCGCFQSGYKS